MDGRYFGGQKLAVSRYNGEHYKKTEEKRKKKHTNDNEDHEEERIQDYINKVGEQ